MIASAIDRFVSWYYTRRLWGERCADYSQGCHCCDRWRRHDEMFNEHIEYPPLKTEDELQAWWDDPDAQPIVLDLRRRRR